MPIDVTVSAQVPDDVQVLGVPVFAGRRQPDKAAVELDMAYLADNAMARARLDRPSVLEGARSIVCVGHRYGRAEAEEASDPPLARGIARYARGPVEY